MSVVVAVWRGCVSVYVALSVCIPGSPHVFSVVGPVGSVLIDFCYLNQFTPRLCPKLWAVRATIAPVAITFQSGMNLLLFGNLILHET